MNEKTIHVLLVEDEEAHIELIHRAFERAFESQSERVSLTVVRSLGEARASMAASLTANACWEISLLSLGTKGAPFAPSSRSGAVTERAA